MPMATLQADGVLTQVRKEGVRGKKVKVDDAKTQRRPEKMGVPHQDTAAKSDRSQGFLPYSPELLFKVLRAKTQRLSFLSAQ